MYPSYRTRIPGPSGAAALPGRDQASILNPSPLLWSVPMVVLAALIFNHFGRPFEFILSGYKIPFTIGLIGILAVLVTGAMRGLWSSPGRPLFGLVVWMLISTPLSTWKGGSTQYVVYLVGLEVVLFLLAASAPRSFRAIRLVCYLTLGAASVYLLIATRAKPDSRFDLRGTFGNADDVALMAGFILPFLILLVQQIKNPVGQALCLIVGGGWLVRVVGMTGTRTGMIAMACLLAVYFLYGSLVQRISVVMFSFTGFIALLILLPASTLQRFETTFQSFGSEAVVEEHAQDEAYASVLERRDLMRDAIKMTLQHPIFGVGPGEFMDYRYQFLDPGAPGGHKRYFPSHNTYLQVSSEDGMVGLVFYLGFLVATFLSLKRSMKLNRPGSHPYWEFGRQLSITLQAALIYFMVCAAAMTCERHPHQYLVAGLAVALERISSLLSNSKPAKTAVSIPAKPEPKPRPELVGAAPAAPRRLSALRRPR